MNPVSQQAKQESLREWRELHFGEMDTNLSVWKSIRDNSEAKDKDRIEAAKNIARALACIQPDAAPEKKPITTKQVADAAPTFQTSKEEEERIRILINGV